MNLRPRNREDPEINLISMIDVLLVLLIFFMVSTTKLFASVTAVIGNVPFGVMPLCQDGFA